MAKKVKRVAVPIQCPHCKEMMEVRDGGENQYCTTCCLWNPDMK